ncbi:MAG: DUF3726 domain-containing protein [Pelagimonas sp.]|jgi:hypothetical protein|nr:DUF3726 domain-containing protein [Pelagimonas sp.]
MRFAMNEIEAMAKRAARGAGYSWGLAEEAGQAARWLCAQGLDGGAILSAALSEPPGPDSSLQQGAGLSDRAYLLRSAPLDMRIIAQPMLLLPFAAMAARQIGQAVSVQAGGGRAVTDGDRLHLSGALSGSPAFVEIHSETMPCDLLPGADRAMPAPDAWDHLCQLAHRTYAPATEESRARGAGAGLSDND